MPKNNAATFEQRSYCRRCGRAYHLHDLILQNGLLVCKPRCYDDTDNQDRDRIINDILAQEDQAVTQPDEEIIMDY